MDDYDCDVCRGMADNFAPRAYPTEEGPWNPDCYIHQYRCDKPRCDWRYEMAGGGVARCELEAGHAGACRFVFMHLPELPR